MSTYNYGVKAGCLTMAAAIIIASAGGHNKDWPTERKKTLDRGVMFNMFTGVGLLAASTPTFLVWPFGLMAAGGVLFCIPIYTKAFTENKSLLTMPHPLGGFALTIAWILLALKR